MKIYNKCDKMYMIKKGDKMEIKIKMKSTLAGEKGAILKKKLHKRLER